VKSEEIRALRLELKCTARELAVTLGLEPGEVTAWEQGDSFPTKKMIAKLEQLRQQGPKAIVRKKKRDTAMLPSAARLADPEFWQLVRKLLEHPELFSKAQSLAASYPDPFATSEDRN
jgi:transcriptional regulator with XRE-family HTH domain